MSKVFNYDAWLQWVIHSGCQYRCKYCIGAAGRYFDSGNSRTKSIDVISLIKTLDKSRLIYKIGLTGGEPMLVENIINVCLAVTQKHYIVINTNFVLPNANRFIKEINPDRVISLMASLHIEEAERTKSLERFISNSVEAVNRGFNFVATQVAHPALLNRVDELNSIFLDKKIPFKFDPFIGEFEGRIYPDSYTQNELKLINGIINVPKQAQFCNAGYNVAAVLVDGSIQSCMDIKNSQMGNIFKEITFNKRPIKCSVKKCHCAFYIFDDILYQRAMKLTCDL